MLGDQDSLILIIATRDDAVFRLLRLLGMVDMPFVD